MSPLRQLYFDVVHKMIILRNKDCTEESFLGLTLMELLDTKVKIHPHRIVIKHIHRVLLKDDKGHALPYTFWLSPVFEEYSVIIQVYSLHTMKDVIGSMHYITLPTLGGV